MLRALIIDDEVDVCYLLSGILRNRNMQTSYVTSLTEATSALQKQEPSLIFIDNHLPDGKGTDFIKYIRKVSPESKIIMITAHDTPEDKMKAMKAGVDDFISKPFSSTIIYQAIQDLEN